MSMDTADEKFVQLRFVNENLSISQRQEGFAGSMTLRQT